MSEFNPDRFEDKYEHYFTELQQAYGAAFEAMSERYDSDLIHEIDQLVLRESEPLYEGDEFRIAVPADATERLPDRDSDHVETVLTEYRTEIATQLRAVFGLGESS
ncbi:MAG: DUF5783 family protein [Halorhabdus sp.]